MANEQQNLFIKLTKLFRNGPAIKRKVKSYNKKLNSTEIDIFKKAHSDLYANTLKAYGAYDRMSRYSDFQEMETNPEINSALDVYAEESTAQDENGKVLHIYSEDRKIEELLKNLFYDVLNVEFNLTMWTRNLCKFGDFVLFLDIHPDNGVVNTYPIPISEIEREENFDKDNPSAIRFRWVTQGNKILENWQIVHFRLLGNDAFLPYGTSILEGARRIFRQLTMMEDAMLVYRLIRSPERRVFKIDVGAVPQDAVGQYLEQAKNTLKKNTVIDKNTGRVDLRYNSLAVDEDYFLPVRGKESGTSIETLAGGTNTTAIEDVEYLQKKLFAALKVPKAYLGYDDAIGSKSLLAQEDIRFSRAIARIQRTILSELNKVAMIHLYCHGFEEEKLSDFMLKLSNPSSIAQQQKLELIKTKFEIAGSASEDIVDTNWIRKNILGLSDDAIEKVKIGLLNDRKFKAQLDSIGQEDEGGIGPGGGLGGLDIGSDSGPEESGGGSTPEGLFAHDKPTGSLLTALSTTDAEVDGNLIDYSFGEDEESFNESDKPSDEKGKLFPIKPDKKAKNAFGKDIKNDDRTITVGRLKSNMPDLHKSVSVGSKARKQDTSNRPYDEDFILNPNPFYESDNKKLEFVVPKFDYNMVKTISSMSEKLKINNKTKILSENEEKE